MNVDYWISTTYGRTYDIDGYYGAQCWDYFAYFNQYFKLSLNCHCARTGYVGDLWYLRYQYGYQKYFEFIYNKNLVRDGDWIFYEQHVGMYYRGKLYGQNQYGKSYVTAIPMYWTGFLGIMRYRFWTKEKGVADRYSAIYNKSYKVAYYEVNMRTGGSMDYPVIVVLKYQDPVRCYGYYTIDSDGYAWLYCVCRGRVGFVRSDLLTS